MKKNLLSIVILALLIVNLVMTSVMMFSVTSTNKKTAAVVGDIATILNLEIATEDGGQEEAAVSMEDTAVYDIADEMTILLSKGEDGAAHYALVKTTLSMDMNNDGYKTYGETVGTKENLIKGEIADVLGQYTADEVQARMPEIQEKILGRLSTMFGSDFIYKVTFSEFIVQ